jgi:predicted HTH domain antitoxin
MIAVFFAEYGITSYATKQRGEVMEVTLTIPDNIAPILVRNGSDLPRSILEMAALEAYREGQLTTFQLRELLGLSRMEIDGFLKERGVYLDYTTKELEEDVASFAALLDKR